MARAVLQTLPNIERCLLSKNRCGFSARFVQSAVRTASFIEPLEGRRMLSAGSVPIVSGPPIIIGPPIIVPLPVLPPPLPIVNGIEINAEIIHAKAGVAFSGSVASFKLIPSPVATNSPAPKLTGTINWGDGSSSAATLVRDPAGFTHVDGTHTYSTPGTYTTTITISRFPLIQSTTSAANKPTVIGSAHGKAVVSGTPVVGGVTPGGVNFNATVNKAFTGTVASLTFKVPPGNTGVVVYTAFINWGDGTSSEGQFVDNAAGSSDVTGTHTYSTAGKFAVEVLVTSGPRPGSLALFPTRILAEISSVANVTDATPTTLNPGSAGGPVKVVVGSPSTGAARTGKLRLRGNSAGRSNRHHHS